MNKTLAAIALALACCLAAAACPAGEAKEKKQRTVYIYGGVYDSFTKARLKAVVTLMRADSTVVATDTCNVWNTTSSFGFHVPQQAAQFIIKAEAEGYDDTFARYDLRLQGRKRYYDVPRLLMKRSRGDIYKSVGLDEVVVSGTRVQLAYRGDTLVYDASAFNLPEGSMLDALIRQMPGAELKDDGTIYVNGRKVDYLLLNGKEFFKGKNKVMLENLPYFTVKEVKVYDKSTEKSEMLGRDVEPKDYVMDVSLKREYARSYIANAEAGLGTDSRWAARAFGLYFDDHTRVTLFGNANNVNENRRPGSDGDWSPAKMERGLLSTKQAGLNLMTEDKDKRITDRLEASAQWDDSDNERHNSSLTFASGGDIAGGSSSRSRAKDFTMNVYNYLYLRKLHIANSNDLTYGNSRSRSSERDSTLRDTLTNSSLSEATGRTRRLRYNGFTDWTQPLPWGDDINLMAHYSYYRTRPSEQFSLNSTHYASGLPADRRYNYTDGGSEGYTYRLQASYFISLNNHWNIHTRVSYDQQYSSEDDSRYRLERLDAYADGPLGLLPSTRDSLLLALDRDNSASTTTMKRTYGGELSIIHSLDESYVYINLPLSRSTERLGYARAALDTTATRSYWNFTPYVRLRFGKDGDRHEFTYRMRISQPDFASLMPYENTSDALATRINNPDLKALTRHSVGWKTTLRCDSAHLTWYIGADANVTTNDIGTRTTYNSSTGAYTYMDDNVQGNWDLNVKTGLNGTLDAKRRLRYAVDANAKYTHSVDFDVAYDTPNALLSTVKTVRTGLNLRLTYTLGKLTAGLSGKLDSRHSRSGREGFEPINVFDYQYGANLQYTIPAVNLNLATDIKMFSRRGYGSPEMNTDDLAWNAQLSRSFLKGRLTAKLTAYDILRQISTKAFSINAQGRTETRYNCIPRYVMLSVAWRLTKKAKQAGGN